MREVDPFHVVYLTGPPATGKSTLVSLLMQSVQPLQDFTYSKMLAEYIAERHTEPLREDQLRAHSAQLITPEDVNAVDQKLIGLVSVKRQQSHIIIDSHAVTKERYGYRVTAFSAEMLKAVRPTMVCMLYTQPEVVISRIEANNQGRPQISTFEAQFHTELQTAVAATYAILLGVPLYLLDSSKPTAELADEIIKQLEAQNPATRRLFE
ncbi:MAG TPA: AAA family ATPase [Herpetosiphonaceae bacterium]|nr:AAA family ATPase [Herpetosiphonaceae bacterium]